jgi:poly(3-hydroxybutyrate) depolymerase
VRAIVVFRCLLSLGFGVPLTTAFGCGNAEETAPADASLSKADANPGTNLPDTGQSGVADGGATRDASSELDGSSTVPLPADGGSDASEADMRADASPGSTGCGLPVSAGMTEQTLVVGGVERSYVLVVPASASDQLPLPVIFGFHGGSDTAQNASRYMQLSGTEAALYVYPQAPYWPEAGGVGWNVDPAGVDFPFFDALLAELGKRHCIDARRVFAAGKSNGGFFVNALGRYRANAIRAIASVAGGGPQSSGTARVAAMIVHGRADMAVTIDKGIFSRDYWRAVNGCSAAAAAPSTPSPCVAYAECATPVLWCEHGGGHDWPAFLGPGIRGFFLGLDP